MLCMLKKVCMYSIYVGFVFMFMYLFIILYILVNLIMLVVPDNIFLCFNPFFIFHIIVKKSKAHEQAIQVTLYVLALTIEITAQLSLRECYCLLIHTCNLAKDRFM